MPEIAIQLSNVTKSFGTIGAVVDVSFDVTEGEVVALLGPSGSGKSTLCRCINRLEAIDSGTITVYGREVPAGGRKLAEFRSNIGMLFQSFNLFPNRTVLDNITLAPIKLRGEKRSAAQEHAFSLLERVGISSEAQKYPAALSGGQQQRAAIARALAMRPKILLFDEPTSALDPESIQEVLDVIADLAFSGITMLIVTHEMGFAKHVSDTIVFMDKGHLLEKTETGTFFSSPRSKRASLFLSKMLHSH